MKYLLVSMLVLLSVVYALPQPMALHISLYDTEDPCEIGHPTWGITSYVIEVRNEGLGVCTNLVVENQIPQQMEFVMADGPVSFQVVDGTVKFQPLPCLKPGTYEHFKIACKAVKTGFGKNTAVVKCDQLPDSIVQEELTNVLPSGASNQQMKAPAIHWSIYDTEDPCYRNRATLTKATLGYTTYVLEIRNEGSAPCSDLQLVNKVPKEMKFISAKAPVSFQLDNANVIFDKIAVLNPKEVLKVRIDCQAVSSGCAKNTVILKSAMFPETVREESTIVREFEPFREDGIVKIELWAIDNSGKILEKLPLKASFSIGGSSLFPLPYAIGAHANPYLRVRTSWLADYKIEIITECYDQDPSTEKKAETIFLKKMIIPEWEPVMIPFEAQENSIAKCYLRFIPDLREEESPRNNLRLHWGRFYFVQWEGMKILATGGASGEIIGINIPNRGFWEISLQQFPDARQEALLCDNEISIFYPGVSKSDPEQWKSPLYKIITNNPMLSGQKYWIWVAKKPALKDMDVTIYARSASSKEEK